MPLRLAGGFSRAAERLFVAQSALSRQVRELEDSIGTPLLRRGPRQVELTPAGRAFLPRAQRLLGDLEAARRLAREVGEGGHGLLRLGHSSSVPLVGGLQAALRGYLAAQSGVRLELTQQSSEQQLADLAEGRLDLGLLRLPVLRQHPRLHLRLHSPPATRRPQLSRRRTLPRRRFLPTPGARAVAQDQPVATDRGRLRRRPGARLDARHRTARRELHVSGRGRGIQRGGAGLATRR